MKKIIFLAAAVSILFFGSCVENSQKYKNLQARLDSLSGVHHVQSDEMEEMLAGMNEISAGLESLREAEHLLVLETEKEAQGLPKSKQQVARLKSDIQAITNAIDAYKEQIQKLENKNRKQSVEFKKMIAGLNQQLEERSQKIEEITRQLAERNQQLAVKTKEVEVLNENVAVLDKETKSQKVTIAEQDQAIHLANYLVGNRKELKEADVISRQGLFCPPIVSSQAQHANFVSIDIREMKSIPLNNKKAKILSVHPAESYVLEAGEDGNLMLKIQDENSFWKQTRYLVVMIG